MGVGPAEAAKEWGAYLCQPNTVDLALVAGVYVPPPGWLDGMGFRKRTRAWPGGVATSVRRHPKQISTYRVLVRLASGPYGVGD